jgi:bifunctional DNA primase/polymerase-like protein/AAA domain-containing protein/primase-like protein
MALTLAAAASAYAARGWFVFPLKPRTKEPVTAHGFKDATTDADQIARWWTETPDANVALHPGPSRVVVIDVDGRDGRVAAVPLGLFSEPTLAVLTGRPGGVHLYYRHPGFPVSNRPLAPHVDVRADEGYVVLPPSVHPSGAIYRWDKERILDLPPQVVALLKNGSTRRAAPLAAGAPIPEGQRNTVLTSLAGSMRRRGMEAPEITAALSAVNAGRCRPPLKDEEIEAIAVSVARYAPAAPPAETPEAGEAEAGPSSTALTRSRSLAEILTDPEASKPPAPVVPGVAWSGRLTLVAAGEGVGKSTLLAAVAAAVTTGGEFLGEGCARGTVLWVLVEEHLTDLVRRAVRFQTAPDQLQVLERPDAPLVALEAEVNRLTPALVIVDTLHAFAAPLVQDKSQSDDWLTVMAALARIARTTNAAVLLAAQGQRATGSYRDSGSIGHGVDVVLNLVRPDKDSPVRRLERQKARWSLDDLQLELVGDTYQRGGTVTKKLSRRRQQVLDALEPPMSYTEWHEASGVPDTTFKRAKRFLEQHGYVVHTDDDTYTEGPQGPDRGHGPHGPEPVGRGHHAPTLGGGPGGPTADHDRTGPEDDDAVPF